MLLGAILYFGFGSLVFVFKLIRLHHQIFLVRYSLGKTTTHIAFNFEAVGIGLFFGGVREALVSALILVVTADIC